MTKEKFDDIMNLVDEAKENREYLAGIQNAVEDGDTYEQHDTVEIEADRSLKSIADTMKNSSFQLGIPLQFLEDVLDSSVVNRWNVYIHFLAENR